MALLAGVAAAVVASALFNLGLVLQAEAARREPVGRGASPGLLGRLAQRGRWWAGTVLAVLGWPFQALALTRAPLTVVQPSLAVGLLLPLALGARRLGDRVRRRDWAAVAAVVAGVTLLVLAAPARRAQPVPPLRLGIALGAVAALGLVAVALAGIRSRRGLLLVAASGLAYAWGSLATKLAADELGRHAWPALLAWAAAAAAAGGIGLLAEMNALQVRQAGGVASLVFALETLVPVALSPVLFGESWSEGAGTLALRVVGLAAAVAGAFELSRAAPVVDALSEQPG